MTSEQREIVEAARRVAECLYRGERVEHRSCGVAVAETFGLNPMPYLVLRRGGLTGEQDCGAVRAGEMALAELIANGQYLGQTPEPLQAAIHDYRAVVRERIGRRPDESLICNSLLEPFGDMASPARWSHCTSLAAEVAALVAEIALRYGADVRVTDIPSAAG